MMELSDAAVAFMEHADLENRNEIAADANALSVSLKAALDQAAVRLSLSLSLSLTLLVGC
jgi:hypothetical protein